MKISEVRELKDDELRGKLKEMAGQLWKARFDNFTNQLDDTSSIKKLRRSIARIKSVLAERAVTKAAG